MIKVNDEFSFEQDTHCWKLIQQVRTLDKKNGNKPTIRERTTYPGSFEQVLVAILERSQTKATGVAELLAELRQSKRDIREVIRITRQIVAKPMKNAP